MLKILGNLRPYFKSVWEWAHLSCTECEILGILIKKLISGWKLTPSQCGSSLTKTMYSQTWVNDHLRIATTCLQRPSFWSPNLSLYNTTLPLNNDHLSTTATNLGFQGWSLYTSLNVIEPRYVSGRGENILKVEYKTEKVKKIKKKIGVFTYKIWIVF